jgi:hypothetical protein
MENKGTRRSITRSTFAPMSVTVTTALATTPAIDLTGASAWAIRSPASAVASVTVWAAESESGTYTRCQVQAADASVALDAAKWNTPDPQIFPFGWVKLVGNAGGVIDIARRG